ncbi:hypothetical protein [Actinoplanes philippinensis]|uniref:hypothetical protein n=1 Tax=Actinoplanes philippinensis TaxID=35752 RepID=UPI00340AFA64
MPPASADRGYAALVLIDCGGPVPVSSDVTGPRTSGDDDGLGAPAVVRHAGVALAIFILGVPACCDVMLGELPRWPPSGSPPIHTTLGQSLSAVIPRTDGLAGLVIGLSGLVRRGPIRESAFAFGGLIALGSATIGLLIATTGP